MNGSRQISAALADRIRAEYSEVPGLRLTVAQAARFWGIETTVCERALHDLPNKWDSFNRGPEWQLCPPRTCVRSARTQRGLGACFPTCSRQLRNTQSRPETIRSCIKNDSSAGSPQHRCGRELGDSDPCLSWLLRRLTAVRTTNSSAPRRSSTIHPSLVVLNGLIQHHHLSRPSACNASLHFLHPDGDRGKYRKMRSTLSVAALNNRSDMGSDAARGVVGIPGLTPVPWHQTVFVLVVALICSLVINDFVKATLFRRTAAIA